MPEKDSDGVISFGNFPAAERPSDQIHTNGLSATDGLDVECEFTLGVNP